MNNNNYLYDTIKYLNEQLSIKYTIEEYGGEMGKVPVLCFREILILKFETIF